MPAVTPQATLGAAARHGHLLRAAARSSDLPVPARPRAGKRHRYGL